jgi:hypothetical protein
VEEVVLVDGTDLVNCTSGARIREIKIPRGITDIAEETAVAGESVVPTELDA